MEYGSSTDPEDEGFRQGDEPEDTRIGDFKVYGGNPQDRARLSANEPEIIDTLNQNLQEILEDYERETEA